MQLDDRSKGFVHIDRFDHLSQWSEARVDPLQRSNTPLLRRAEQDGAPDGRSKLMLIHDYEGSYLDYEACQGTVVDREKYSCEYLQHVEVFVYFSHRLVTVPPPTWTNTCHRNGVKALGTFIVEPDTPQIEQILQQQNGEFWVARQLANIAQAYGFDGWLINIEKPFPISHWSCSDMEAFLRQLRSYMGPSRKLVWYDALTSLNIVWYQNTLNYLNLAFALAAGSILTNYAWNPVLAKQAREIAERSSLGADNVYLGIDAWAQNTHNGKHPRVTYPPGVGGGTGIGIGIKELAKIGVNVGVFAPGWSFEHFKGHNHEVERAVWLGDNVSTDLVCDCTPIGLHLTVPYQEHPIVKYVASHPAGSSSFLHTDFRTAFWQCDRSDDDLELHTHLGRQSVLPISRRVEFRSEASVNSDSQHACLRADVANNPSRCTFSVCVPSHSLDSEKTPISARFRLFNLSITDAKPIELRLVYRKADTTGVALMMSINDSVDIDIPEASQVLTTTTKSLPNAKFLPLRSLDLVLSGTLGTVRRLGNNFMDLMSLTIKPSSASRHEVKICNLRIEQRGSLSTARYRLVWNLPDNSPGPASEGTPFSLVTGPFSHFRILVDDASVGVAFALEYEISSNDLTLQRSGQEVMVTIVGVGFDGLIETSVRKSLLWPTIHEDDWVLV